MENEEKTQFASALSLARAAAIEAGGQPPCSNAPDLWFDDGNYQENGRDAIPTQADYSQAKALCASCEIIIQCRTHALRFKEPYGVWGGLSPIDRSRIYRTIERRNANPNPESR